MYKETQSLLTVAAANSSPAETDKQRNNLQVCCHSEQMQYVLIE